MGLFIFIESITIKLMYINNVLEPPEQETRTIWKKVGAEFAY